MATPTGRPSGRPATPIEKRRAMGNPSKRPLPETSGSLPSIGSEIPKPPRDLGKKGKLLWNTVWTAGQSTGHLSPLADSSLVLMLCQAYDEAETIRDALNSGEIERFYLMSNGSYASHPYVKELQTLRTQITAWISMLGFTPTDRARLGIGEVKDSDPLNVLEERKAKRQNEEG